MPDPFRPQTTVDSAARLAADVSTLRSETQEIEQGWPITIVRTTNPSGTDLAREGTVWINQTSGRMYVSAAPGTWISADAQRLYQENLAQVCTTTSTAAGPSVSIFVPPNGIVGFHARMEAHGGTVGPASFSAVSRLVEGTDFPGGVDLTLETVTAGFVERSSVPGNLLGTLPQYAGWIVYRATPGLRSYNLTYISGGGATSCWQNRHLWVATF